MKTSGLRVLLAVATAFASASVAAHGDEVHGQPPGAPGAVAPANTAAGADDTVAARREADGSLFVPKAMQYQLGLRTRLARIEALAATAELAGQVVADPNASGRVQASQAGRIEPGPKGLPMLGQRVDKGQVLAHVQPTIDNVERGNQQAELASLDAQLSIAKSRLARYRQLEGAVPRKDIEAARVDVESLQARRAAIGTGLSAREALRAPVSGIVSATAAVPGQLVEPREVLFEIIDPSRLAIEALAYDATLASGVQQASAIVAGGSLELEFVGAGRHLRGQALPMLFRARTGGVALAIGQPLQVIAHTARRIQGVGVPREALVRNRAGEIIVWVHGAAERFTPRRIVSEALDGQNVAVTSGIASGERVVVSGASLLTQVR